MSTTIYGTAIGDSLVSGVEDDVLLGLGGNDTLTGQGGNDSLSGSDGNDIINGGTGRDTMSGGDGEDVFVIRQGDTFPAGLDVITDWSSEDRFSFTTGPGAYQETSAPDAGRNHANALIAAGARFVAVQTPTGVILYMDTAANGGQAEDAVLLLGRTLDDISAVNVGSAETLPTAPEGPAEGPGPLPPPSPDPTPPPPTGLNLIGTPDADTLTGGAGADTINGLGGDDVITGGDGNDVLNGGDGLDTLVYATAGGGMNVTLGAGGGAFGAAGTETPNGFERVVGSAFADTITGSSGAETLEGGAGNDVVIGAGGANIVRGEAGDDRVSGAGTVSGGDGNDTVSGSSADGTSVRLEGDAGDDMLSGATNNETLVGGAGDDTLSGDFGADHLFGGAGADRFTSYGGRSLVSSMDTIHDWDSTDLIDVRFGVLAATYAEGTAGIFQLAQEFANSRIASGAANFVSVQVGSDVIVFVDEGNDDGVAEEGFRLVGRTLADISIANFITARETEPTPGPPPGPQQFGTASVGGQIAGNMDSMRFSAALGGTVTFNTPTGFELVNAGARLTVSGTGFTYREDQTALYDITGGTVFGVTYDGLGLGFRLGFTVSGGVPVATMLAWTRADAAIEAFSTLLAGNDRIQGGMPTDLLRGYGGDDRIDGLGGSDTIYGGAGNDFITVNDFGGPTPVGNTYLRGDEGDDYIMGGAGFDDINGNMGNDTGVGGTGNDWVVGGRDNDMLFGDAGNDLVYGNLGSDTCVGGEGNDTLRGGQENDLVRGGDGDDYVSGDRGDDTMVGGAGADIFHSFGTSDLDRVTDFRANQGDRVQLDPGTQYTLAQVGEDVVISMTGGGQMILVGVQLSSLPAGWIFGV